MTEPDASPAKTEGRDPLRPAPTAGFQRALGLTALGTVLPGAGLTQTRRRRLGWALFVIAAVAAVALAVAVLTKGATDTVLSVVSRPGALQWLTVGFVAVGLVWCASIVLTAVLSRPRRLGRARTGWLAAFTTVMVLIVAATSVRAAQYAAITKDTVSGIFAASDTANPGGSGVRIAQGGDPWVHTKRVNILLLGSDAGVDRTGTRTDSIVVASIDTQSGRTALISLPRNLMNAPLPQDSPLNAEFPGGVYGQVNGTPSCPTDGPNGCLLNSVWTVTDLYRKDHPKAFGAAKTPGRDQTRDVISQVLGLPIDQTVVIDLKGFQQLIDAMGGVDVNVKLSGNNTKMPIGGHLNETTGRMDGHVLGYFEPGRAHLDGFRALWYARSRAADSDSYRQARQRCVVQAIVRQVNPARMVAAYADIARIAKANIYTDMPASSLTAYVELVQRVQQAKITNVALTSDQKVFSSNPDYSLVRRLVQKGIAAPAPRGTSSKPSRSAPPTTSTVPTTGTAGESPIDQYGVC